MNQMRPDTQSDSDIVEALLAPLKLRLKGEVTRLRALRGDGRTEAFAGLMMSDADIAALCNEMTAPVRSHPEPFHQSIAAHAPLARLVQLYELGVEAQAVLLLALAAALDPRFGRIYGFLHEDMAQQYLTPALAQRLVPAGRGAGIRATLDAGASLLRHGLLHLTGDKWVTARVEMSDAMVRLLLGPGEAAPDCVTILPLPGLPDWHNQPRLVQASALSCPIISGGFAGPLWVCEGAPLQTARECGVAAALAGASIAFSGWDAAPLGDRRALANSLGRHSAILTDRPDLWQGLGTAFALQSCPPTSFAQRRAFWHELAGALAPMLAASHLGTATLWRLVQEASFADYPAACLAEMIRHHRTAPMVGLADRIACPHDFDDLILPEPAKARLRGFAARQTSAPQVLEDWGLGHSLSGRPGGIALFTGPSGVGKTMAAGAVARATGLDLMRINLATVVSKYIGETESNLERIFSAASQSEVILFFDEAESLFSKRAEVKDAHDRYANLEMSFLLQRIESFHGMAILASNMGATLDPALLRRFNLVLEFALPEAPARRAIWEKLASAAVPLSDDVNLDDLAARFDIAGGHIRQAILSAAHEAAQGAGVVTQALLIQGTAREYVKLGRTLRREDFGAAYGQIRGR